MGFGNQLQLLLWKNFTLRRRQPFRVVVEILWPLALFLILVLVRFRPGLKENQPECHFEAKAMPSAGTLPFIQSYICTFNNDCFNATDSEVPGSVPTFSSSVLSMVVQDVQTLLASKMDRGLIVNLIQDIRTLQMLFDVLNNGSSTGTIEIGGFLLDPEQFQQMVLSQNISLTPEAIETLLNASISVQQIFQALSSSNSTGQGISFLNRTGLLGNLTNFIQSLMVPGANGNVNGTLLMLREQVCREDMLQKWLVFSNMTTALSLQRQLCNLSLQDGLKLLQDFRDAFDVNKTLAEIQSFVTQNTGLSLKTEGQVLRDLMKIANEIRQLESMQLMVSNISEQAREFSEYLANTTGQRNTSTDISRFLCGRFHPVFNLNPSDTSNNEEQQNTTKTENCLTSRNKKPNETNGPCQEIYGSLEQNAIIWHQLKPIILGVIPYAPDTPAVRKIIKEANRTFASFGAVVDLATQWVDYYPQLYSYLDTNAGTLKSFIKPVCSVLRSLNSQQSTLFNLPFNIPGVGQQQPNYTAICDFLERFLGDESSKEYTWKDALNNTNNYIQLLKTYSQCFRFDKFQPYASEAELVEKSLQLIESNTFWAALIFDVDNTGDTLPTFIKYKIRMNSDYVDSTKRIRDKYWRPGPRANPITDTKYTTYGFAHMQDMVDHAIIRLQANITQEVGVILQQFPYPCWIKDRFVFAISRSLPLFMVISWIYSVAMIVKGIVYEKEMRLKEVMKIMGLGNGVHWLAWFINALVIMFFTIVLFCLVLKVGKVLEHSDPTVIFAFMLTFTVATISQCFLISVFFSRANLAAVCGGFIYFILYLPYTQLVQWEEYTSTALKLFTCLSSNIAFGFGCSYIARYEEQAIGSQWHNIHQSPVPEDNFNLQACMWMMLLDACLYLLLTWYIEAVFPGQYGIPRRWYFPIQRSYWCGERKKKADPNIDDFQYSLHGFYRDNANVEMEPAERPVGVAVRNLRKVYSNGKKLAVDNLTINFYEGHITSFLGHNGAGKTTTMSILTGLYPPTSGTAYIYGKDITTSMDEIRQSLGMCPQHNVLFDLLTVEEHIWFYARLKGRSEAEVQREMLQMIKDVGLPHKRKEKSCNLSGGMKRKLSVAIAFVGGSKTVILDEPTAGVDPHARRSIWELLLKLRKGRTIILSTHHMDEADVLGDRIAIISHGSLCCLGSSLFLKNRFGSGYYLTLVRSDTPLAASSETEKHEQGGEGNPLPLSSLDHYDLPFGDAPSRRPTSASSVRSTKEIQAKLDDEGFDDSNGSDDLPVPTAVSDLMIPEFSLIRLRAFLEKYLPEAKLVEDNSMEVCFQIPDSAAKSGHLTNLFAELEKFHPFLGISSYGISDTSLEEVFLKVTEENSTEEEEQDEYTRRKLEDISDHGRYPRPVSRLSFRSKKRNFFCSAVDDKELLNDTDDNGGPKPAPLGDSIGCDVSSEEGNGFSGAGEMQLTGKQLTIRQVIALLIKRFHHVRRSKKGFISEYVLPAAFVCLAMVFSLIQPPVEDMPPLELHPWHYEPTKGESSLYIFYSNDNPSQGEASKLEKTLLSSPFHGARCMNPKVYNISGYSCLSSGTENFSPRPKLTGDPSQDSPACSCASGFQRCPDGAGGPEPAQRFLQVNDHLYNMTGRNISDWLVKTMEHYMIRRFGGFSFGDENLLSHLNASQMAAAINEITSAATNGTVALPENIVRGIEEIFEYAVVQDNAKVWFNNKAWASSVAYMSSLNNIILRSYLPPARWADYGIATVNHPMNFTKDQLDQEFLMNSAVDVVVAICVIFAMSFVPASFVLFLIEERVSNSKHLQFVSGINPTIYWVTNFIWDMMNYLIPAVLCIFIFLAFGKDAYVSSQNAPCLVCLLFLYGWAITPMMYPFSRIFSVPSSAFVALSCVNVFLGTVSTLATFILELLGREDPDLEEINVVLKQVFLLLPHYCLGRGLIDMAAYQLQADLAARYGQSCGYNIFKWNIVGRNMFSLFLLGVLFFIINWLIEYKFFITWRFGTGKVEFKSQAEEDIDVAKERQRVISGGAKSDVMKLENLTKVYWAPGRKGKMRAVDHLCVGIPQGQCFGLLGVNGAGKTTTFKMLTGDINVTKGDACINGYSIKSDIVKVRQHMGYCPQFDALDSLLTGREHLEFYARIRGIPRWNVKSVANWAISKLGLTLYADKVAGSYSGGNKRKLSTAIALIGNPPIIFLDEPTTGMDPKARRFLWNCINNTVKSGRSVILTSHSMEECEALCGRLAIMVNGTFKCIGSIQHLKNRFGNGYTIILRVAGQNPVLEPVMNFIVEQFPSAVLREQHHNMVQYQLGSQNLSLSQLFAAMEEAKRQFSVEDYSISQTTLDQVFINFAKNQTDILDDTLNAPDNLEMEVQNSAPHSTGMELGDGHSAAGTTIELVRTSNDKNVNNIQQHPLQPAGSRQLLGVEGDNDSLSDSIAGSVADSLTGSTVELIRPSSSRTKVAKSALADVSIA